MMCALTCTSLPAAPGNGVPPDKLHAVGNRVGHRAFAIRNDQPAIVEHFNQPWQPLPPNNRIRRHTRQAFGAVIPEGDPHAVVNKQHGVVHVLDQHVMVGALALKQRGGRDVGMFVQTPELI